jgi:large subunit ribosomal protein L32
MAVPKRKHSNARTGSRRSHDRKKLVQRGVCPTCSELIPTHVICPVCGSYMSRKVIEIKDGKKD